MELEKECSIAITNYRIPPMPTSEKYFIGFFGPLCLSVCSSVSMSAERSYPSYVRKRGGGGRRGLQNFAKSPPIGQTDRFSVFLQKYHWSPLSAGPSVRAKVC